MFSCECVLCAERWTEENEMNQLKNVYIYPHVGVVSGPTPTQPLKKKKKKKKEEEESWKLGKQKWLHTQIPESIWCKKKRKDCNRQRHYLTLSLSQPVKFPGSTMPHGCACKQYIFRSYNTSVFSAIPFEESPFTCQCEKEDRKAFKGFRFCTLTSRDVMATKRLNQTLENWAKDIEWSFYRILVSDFWTN